MLPIPMRPLSATIRRVWKTSSLRPIVASRRPYGTTLSKPRVAAAKTATKATQTRKAAPAKKTTKKPVKKAVKQAAAKPKKKPAAKKKPAPKKRILTDLQKERLAKKKELDKLRARKETALLSSEPKKLPARPWLVFSTEYRRNADPSTPVPLSLKDASLAYQSIPPAETERLNHIAKQNSEANEIAYKKWVASFTPDQIRLANAARKALRQKRKATHGKTSKYQLIHDERQPKRPVNAFALFIKERWASGDFKGLKIMEAIKLATPEFKALNAAEKKVYEDEFEANRLRYQQEQKTVFQ